MSGAIRSFDPVGNLPDRLGVKVEGRGVIAEGLHQTL